MAENPAVYLRGALVPADEAHLSIYDFGIVLGATVTDLLCTFRREPFRLQEHLRRFYASCKYARITPPISLEETADVTRDLVRRNGALLPPYGELAVVYFITPGENLVYAGSAACESLGRHSASTRSPFHFRCSAGSSPMACTW